MFKRIMKISGIVLLAFVLIIGGVVAFLAIRGDFKKKVIKPTSIEFSIEETKLLFDVGVDANKVNSFTISAEPTNITENECTIKLSDTSLIEFVTWVDGKWEVYKSNTFYLNRPIYFRVKDINVENADLYTDGVLTITVTDKTGLLHKTLDLEIDRAVTSVSLMDLSEGGEGNNKISNGLFGYEKNYGGVDGLRLMSIIGQDYPLNFLSAPLKADKPFASREAKRSEIYYIENGQSKLLTCIEDPTTKEQVFKLSTYNQATGKPDYEDCEFLRFDVDSGNYILNSQNSKSYEFKLAMYPTYAVQDEVLSGSFSLSERLGKMVTKTVIIDVSGTEATEIRFERDSESIDMKLFEDNKFAANNPLALSNLGIVLSKSDSEGKNSVDITGRYSELKFLDDASYTSGINWTLQDIEVINGNNVVKSTFNINIFNQNDTYTAEITGNTEISDWIGNPRYDVQLTKDNPSISTDLNYSLTLTYKTQDKGIKISIPLVADKVTGKALSLSVAEATGRAQIEIIKSTSSDKGATYNDQPATTQSWSFVSGSIMIAEADAIDADTYHIKTLKDGIYLSILDNKKCINQDSFITDVQFDYTDGNNTTITIKPIKAHDLEPHTIKMYAIVVNGDGTWQYTHTPHIINVSDRPTGTKINNGEEALYLPVQVDADELLYGEGIDVAERVSVTGTYANAGYLMFAPEVDYIKLDSKPVDWSKTTYYKWDGDEYIESTDYIDGNCYRKITNNFEMIKNINFEYDDKTFYLIGYFNEAGKFVNKVKANGLNYGSRIYIVTPKAEYIKEENRLQSATEYVDGLMKESYAISGNIKYDKSLITGRKVFNINTGKKAYIKASNKYDAEAIYYDSSYNTVTLSEEDINNWATRYINYYEYKEVDLINAEGSEYVESRVYYGADGKRITPTSVVEGQINSDDAYLIVDHYNITGVTYSDSNVTIKATASVYGQSFGTEESFTITLAGTDKLSIPPVNEFDGATYIVANSYYDFEASSIKPTSQYGGEYFSNEDETKVGDGWKIVAEHSSIQLDWDGEKNGRLISEQVASAVLTINHKHSSKIIDDMLLSIEDVGPVEFDSNGNIMSATKDAVTVTSLNKAYALATGEFVDGMKYYEASYTKVDSSSTFDVNNIYYNKVEEDYNIVKVTAETFETMKENLYLKVYQEDSTVTQVNYSTKKASLYVEVLKVDFKVMDTIAGDYMKLQWIYRVNSEIYFTFYSPKLYVKSNLATGYKIDAGIKTESTYRKAVLLTDTDAPSDWVDGDTFYTRDGKNFASGLVGADYTSYEPNKYYRIDVDADITEDDIVNVNYIIEIGYSVSGSAYTYTVFACDKDGNLFVSMDGTTTAVAIDAIDAFNTGIKTSVSEDAFNTGIKTSVSDSKDARWIKPVPAYAQNVGYELSSANNLTFTRADNSIHTITSAQINDEAQTLILTDLNDKTIKLEITIVKIVQDGKFVLSGALPGDEDEESVNSTTYTINAKSYTYATVTDITEKLKISIGTVYTPGYTKPQTKHDDIVITDGGNPAKTVTLKFEDDVWKFTRNTSASIEFDVIVTSVLGTRTFTLNFTSPWDRHRNESNTTEKIYSGTTFVLANVLKEDPGTEMTKVDPLYRIIEATQTKIKITYAYTGNEGDKSGDIAVLTGSKLCWTVPTDVTESTDCTFKIYYTGIDPAEEIDTFVLTICPNIILTGDISDKELNDYNQTSVNLADLNLKQYKTETTDQYTYYPEYEEDADKFKNVKGDDIEYVVNTYEDTKHEIKYTTNVADIPAGETTLNVKSPISEAGTYYVVVSVKLEDILVGEIEFEVTTTSELKSVDEYGNVQDIQDINLTATETQNYDLSDLQSMFNLQRNGEFYYYEVDSYEAGKTYKWDDSEKKYVPLTSEETGTNYYQKSTLTDIFWIHTEDSNLEIVYKYENYTLTQKGTTLTIEDVSTSTIKTYKLVVDSTSINIIENNAFDISTGKFKNIDDGKQDKVGNVHYIKEGGKSIYCTQNSYLFQNTVTASSNEYIVLSAESTGKTIYKFTVGASENKVEYNSGNDIKLTNFDGIALKYNGFGANLSANALEVARPEYSIEGIFKIDENKHVNIKDGKSYNISVAPYKVASKTKVLLSDDKYTLYDETTATKGLFDIKTGHDDKISSIEFGNGDYTLGKPNSTSKTRTITASAKGNSYTLTLPVKLTYKGGKTYRYDVEFTVLNKTQVEILYPFVVDSLTAENNAYGLFNSSITNITNGIVVNEDGTYARLSYEQFDKLYTDIGETLGYDTGVAEWFNDASIKFDVALRGDTIKLTTDDLLNINRYQAYSFKNVWQTDESEAYSANTYYTYNAITNKFEVISDTTQPSDWDTASWKYFSRVEKGADSIASTELVAVSATYADVLDNVVDLVNIYDNNTIQISPSLSVSGYLVFKVTTTNGSYGYYILKVLVNDKFNSVFNYDATTSTARRTRSNTTEIKPDGTSKTIKDVIIASGKSISDLGEIDASFVDSDWNNVYIFMVNNSIVGGGNIEFTIDGVENKTYNRGELIPKSAIIETNTNVQTLIVAVVIEHNGELVYVGNYRLALSPNVDVTQGLKVKKYNDSLYYQYELKEPHKYTYGADIGATATANTLTFDSDYFTVIINDGEEPTSPTVSFDNSKAISGEVKIAKPSDYKKADGTAFGGDTYVVLHNSFGTWFNSADKSDSDFETTFNSKWTECTIASINASNRLVIEKPISIAASFWLELTYGSGSDKFNIYLKFNIAAYTFVSDAISDKTVGLWNGTDAFNTTLDLTTIFGNYDGDFAITYEKESGSYVKLITKTGNTITNHDSGIAELDGTNLNFVQGTTENYYTLRITLNDVLTPIYKDFKVTVKPSITSDYHSNNSAKEGSSSENPIITKITNSDIKAEASCIYVNVTNGGKTILIKPYKNGVEKYLINVNACTKIVFNLSTESGETVKDMNKYILSGKEIVKSASGFSEDNWINFAHTTKQLDLKLSIEIYNGEAKYSEVVELYIRFEPTYILTAQYRAKDAEFETVVSGTSLDTNSITTDSAWYTYDDANKKYAPYTTVSDPQPTLYSISTQLLTADSYSGEYYSYDSTNSTYTKETATYEKDTYYKLTIVDINNHLFGYKAASVNNENVSRFVVTLINRGRPDSTATTSAVNDLYTMQAIGLLTPSNPNYLNIAEESDCCTYANGILTFTYDEGKSQQVMLSISNDTISELQYTFQVMTKESDFSVVKYNTNLLHIDANGDNVMDYISVTLDELRNEDFVLATLNYAPVDDPDYGTIGYINQSDDDPVKFKFDGKNVIVANYGDITADTFTLTDNFAVIRLSIVTVDGCERTVDIVVSDFKVDYGYIKSGQNYEQLYGGTEGWDITKTILTSDTTQRIALKNGSNITPDFTSNFAYYSAVEGNIVAIDENGKSSHLALGTTLGTSYVSWNSSKNTFGLRSVNDSGKYVTIMFNVTQTVDGTSYVIGRVYYCVKIINDIKIGMNRQMGDVTRYNLYLGSEIYDKYRPAEGADGRKTYIDLLSSKDSTENIFNNIFITLEQYSTGNVIYDNGNLVNKALYNGSAGADGKPDNINKTYSVYSSSSVGNYLSFAVDNVSSGLKDKDTGAHLVEVDSTTGMLTIIGNVEGTFDLLVYSTNGSGYGKSFTIQVHKYYEVVTKFNNSVDNKGGGGYISGEKVSLIKSGGVIATGTTSPINSNYAINIHMVGVKDLAGNVGYIEDDATTTYTALIVPASTAISAIKQSADWPIMSDGLEHSTVQYDLPNVPYPSNPNETEYYTVAVRCKHTHRGTEDIYYAFYKVYNNVSVSVNPHYIANGRTITYNETNGAWSSDGNGNIITIMDTANTGLYSLLTPLTSKPEGWTSADETKNYMNYYKAKFDSVTSPTDDVWKEGLYYQKDSDDNYTLLTSKPTGWTTGIWFKIDTYESLSSESAAPEWTLGDYYTYNSIKTLADLHDLGVKLMVEDSTDPTGYKTYEISPYDYEQCTDDAEWSDRLQYYYIDDDSESEAYGQFITVGSLTEEEFEEDPTKYYIRHIEVDHDVITAILPDNLFTNKAKMYVALVDLNTNTELLKQEWTIQGDKTIENYDSRPLSDFFLQSEIGQKWYNTEIIGINPRSNAISYTLYVKGSGVSVAKDDEDENIISNVWDGYGFADDSGAINGYKLMKVTYVIDDESSVFDTKQDYYVLQGMAGAMKINFNAGSSIVITIDDSRLDKDAGGNLMNSATIDLSKYVLWYSNVYSSGNCMFKDYDIETLTNSGGAYSDKYSNSMGIITGTYNIEDFTLEASTDATGYTTDGSSVIISDVTDFTKSEEIDLTLILSGKCSGSTYEFKREVQVVFNYVINAKAFDADGNIEDGERTARNLLTTKLASKDSLTAAEVNYDLDLKKALLGLISYRDSDIDISDEAIDKSNSVYNLFNITISKTEGEGTITYTLVYNYKDAVSEYTRTFTLADTAGS